MPTLDWIGKAAVVNHHRRVGYHLLRCDRELSAGDADAGNLLVQGDNLLALKALLPYYAGKVKCIYIDPPYNTGNENWIYNDNVNSPEIRQWLRQTVGKEGEDLSRHDKWLCMMYPRLALLRDFLTEDGAIFISIDDNEIGNLLTIAREIFGGANQIATIVWEKGKKGDAKLVSVTHEYIVAFARNKELLKQRNVKWRRKKPGVDEVLEHYTNLRKKHGDEHAKIRKDMMSWYRSLSKTDPRKAHKHYNWSDARGLYFAADFAGPDDGRESRPRYPILHPVTRQPCSMPSTGWRWEEDTTNAALAENPPRIHFGKDHTTIPNRKSYLFDIVEEPMLSVFYKDGRAATLEVESMLGLGAFPFPKDSEIIANLIGMVASEGDYVLDSFAGSGTTAHAVLRLNQHNSKPVRFILVEMDEAVAQTKTRERIKKAIEGFTPATGKKRTPVAALGGGFRFCKLGAGLFDDAGNIASEVKFPDLAAHVFFTETGVPIPARAKPDCPLLGVHNGKAIYLLFNGVLGDKRPAGGNVLTHAVAQELPAHPAGKGLRVVFGEACRLGAKSLEHYGITFRQVPFELKVD